MSGKKLLGGKEGAKEKDKKPVNELKGREPRLSFLLSDDDIQNDVHYWTQNLKNNSWRMREEAALNLGRFKDASAVPALIEALGDGFNIVRKSAAIALGTIGVNDEQFETIVQMLRSGKTPEERAGAARALERIKNASAVSVLTEALEDEDKDVRRIAVDALKAIKNPPVFSALDDEIENGYISEGGSCDTIDYYCDGDCDTDFVLDDRGGDRIFNIAMPSDSVEPSGAHCDGSLPYYSTPVINQIFMHGMLYRLDTYFLAFEGQNPDGNPLVSVGSGENLLIDKKPCPIGKETVLEIRVDGKNIVVTPVECNDMGCQLGIRVEDIVGIDVKVDDL